jgi:hypothetical protein
MSSTEINPPPDSQVTKDTNNERALDSSSTQPDTSAQRSVQAWDDMNKLLKSGTFEAKSASSQNPEIARMLGKDFGIDLTPPSARGQSALKEQGAMSATVDPVQDKKPEDKDAGKSIGDNSQGDKEQSTAGRSARPDGQKQAETDHPETELKDGKKKDQKQAEKKTEKQSFFTEPYDATKADKLIKDLGDDSFKTREAAQAKLERMGPQALEKLQEASKDKDPEVSKRADRAINTIKTHEQQEARDKALDQAKTLGPAAEAMLRSLNIDYSKQIQPVTAEEGAIGLIGPSFVIGQPKGVPTAEQQKQIDRTLSDLDKAGAGSKKISALEKSEKDKVADEYATDKITADTKESFANMRLLDSASKYARLNYAEALSKSDKAADKTKAVDVLTDHVNKQESFKPTDEFRQLAASTGADKSEKFIKAIERRCGKDVADSFRSQD